MYIYTNKQLPFIYDQIKDNETVYLFATLRLPSLKHPENHLTGCYDHIQPLENNAYCPK